jgi:hypothetical protein
VPHCDSRLAKKQSFIIPPFGDHWIRRYETKCHRRLCLFLGYIFPLDKKKL